MPRDRSEFDDLAPLIKLIRAHPPFDRETELVVTRKARKGDKRAQEKLVVHNLSLVISVARKFMGRGVRLEDLVQEGNYGLLKAIEHFDPEKGNRFSTYAVWWIRAYITRCLKDGPSAVRRTMPNGGLPPRDISLEETLGTDGDSDATHLDRLADEGPGPDAQLLRAEQNEDVRNALGRVRKRMGELAWDILSDRLTQDDPRTLEDLGKQWGLSRERVRQVEKSTRERILDVVVEVDGRPVSAFGCDGVLCATPTGSTAYAFSAGGPLVWPQVEALLLVPSNAHALFARPMVISPDSHVAVEVAPSGPPAVLDCDGRRTFPLPAGTRVEVTRGVRSVHMVRLDGRPFADRLVRKFDLPVRGWRGAPTAADEAP